jgi:hypothetical protein
MKSKEPTRKQRSAVTAAAAARRDHKYKHVNPVVGERHKAVRANRAARRKAKRVAAGTWKPYGNKAREEHAPNPQHLQKHGKKKSNVVLLRSGAVRCGNVEWERLSGTVRPPFTGLSFHN